MLNKNQLSLVVSIDQFPRPTKPFCLLFSWTNSDQTCASRGSPDPTAFTHDRTAIELRCVYMLLGRRWAESWVSVVSCPATFRVLLVRSRSDAFDHSPPSVRSRSNCN